MCLEKFVAVSRYMQGGSEICFFSMNWHDVVAILFCSRALTLKWLTYIFNFGMKTTFYFSEG
jgi:hypothetical protein